MKKYVYTITFCLLVFGFASAQIDRSKQPVPKAAPAIKLGQPETFELPNGLKVLVVKNSKLPTARIQLLIDNPLYATEDKAGVETMLGAILGNGTSSITKDAFHEEIDFLGASVGFSANGGNARTLSKYFDRVFELFASSVIDPLLSEEEFQKEKSRYLESLKNDEKSVTAISRQVSSALLYGKKHPKGEYMTEKTLAGITLADVKNYYNSFFSPENAYLVVVGDVETAKVKALANIHFSSWVKKKVPNINYSNPLDVQFTQINFIDMPNAVQSELVVQNVVDLKMDHPDYFPVLIANTILGGDFNSLLNMKLREEKAWTYGARSSAGAGKYVSRFIATTSVRNSVTDSAVVEMLNEIRNIRENQVTTEQLALAKSLYTGNFVLVLERSETIANYALNIKTQNLPDNFYENYLKKINAVTVEDVQRVAKKYFSVDNARIVVAGKGSEVLEGLKNIKNADGKTIPVLYFDIFGNEVSEPVYKIEMDPSMTSKTVIENYLKAIGGKEALENVNTLHAIYKANMQGMELELEEKATKSNKSLQSLTMGGMVLQKKAFDGTKGYTESQGKKTDLSEDEIIAAKETSYPFPELHLSAETLTLKGIEIADGKKAYAIQYNDEKVAYYDVESGLKIKEEKTLSIDGNEIKSATFYGDYKEVTGIKLPHAVSISSGLQDINFSIVEVKINESIADEDFK